MLINRILARIRDTRWTIGLIENSLEDIANGEELKFKWVECNYRDRWFADPFVLDVTQEHIVLLVEEFYYPIKHARISKLIISRGDYKIQQIVPILTLSTHLSYPAIIRREGNIYIYPESGASGKLLLYAYNPKTDEIKEERLLVNEYVADATYTPLFKEDLLFCTIPPKINEDELYVYHKEDDGTYHKGERIVFKDNIARMAGDFFELNGRIYRPAQDCNGSYGKGLVIQEVSRKVGQWDFIEKRRLYSNNSSYPEGLHTLNSYKGVIVVDAVGYWHPRIVAIVNIFTGFVKRLLRYDS